MQLWKDLWVMQEGFLEKYIILGNMRMREKDD